MREKGLRAGRETYIYMERREMEGEKERKREMEKLIEEGLRADRETIDRKGR